jgi:N-acetylglutamate synthase-like GNAT family acetyltransferase
MDTRIEQAVLEDVPALLQLVNNAYRGDASRKGWTTEADLIAGDIRTTAQDIESLINNPGSVILKCVNNQNQIVGCVNLQQHEEKIYLGMLSVSPELQGGGTGKQLLAAAEAYAKQVHCKAIYMTVISVRNELINWYLRHGYFKTGETKPFVEDSTSGKHLQPLEFLVLEKQVSPD